MTEGMGNGEEGKHTEVFNKARAYTYIGFFFVFLFFLFVCFSFSCPLKIKFLTICDSLRKREYERYFLQQNYLGFWIPCNYMFFLHQIPATLILGRGRGTWLKFLSTFGPCGRNLSSIQIIVTRMFPRMPAFNQLLQGNPIKQRTWYNSLLKIHGERMHMSPFAWILLSS